MSDERITAANGHVYPSRYVPPTGNAIMDEAWSILDRIKPDAIDPEIRFYLAGLIAGTLSRYLEKARADEASNAPEGI